MSIRDKSTRNRKVSIIELVGSREKSEIDANKIRTYPIGLHKSGKY